MTDHFEKTFPFTALVGQDDLKTVLLLNAVNPGVGGVLIRGEKGTAKSTAVRALAAVLPRLKRHERCAVVCDPDRETDWCETCRKAAGPHPVVESRVPMVTLPLNATEDRVAGGMDFSAAVKSGKRVLSPGLLARAHRGILYVDEVNLLDDHLVDIILDAAASGENRLEREGMSFRHPSRFILVGTMNPEEGELRPQLLDRFGLCVDVRSERDPEKRVRLMKRKDVYDADPESFITAYGRLNRELSATIAAARNRLGETVFSDSLRHLATELCLENNVAGHRADLVIEQAARAHAALDGRPDVTVDDVRKVAGFVFLHRRREPAPPPPPEKNHDHDHSHEPEQNQDSDHQDNNDKQDQQDHQDQGEDREETEERPEPSSETGGEGEENEAGGEPENRPGMPDTAGDRVFDVGETFKVRSISPPKDRIFRRGSGRRTRSRVSRKQGRYVKSTANRGNGDIAFDATLRAAAPHQVNRAGDNGLCVQLTEPDIREKIREKRIGSFLLFVVDASGSMGARGRMAASKGAVMSLLLDAYQKRDKVAMVTFRKEDAVINLPPTSSIDLAARLLNDMPVGGKTPLCAGLVKGYELVRSHLLKDPLSRPVMILITDGRGNVPLGGSPMKTEKPAAEALALAEAMAREERITFIVVDSESPGPISFGLARKLSGTLNAAYFKIDDLKAETLMRIVKGDPI